MSSVSLRSNTSPSIQEAAISVGVGTGVFIGGILLGLPEKVCKTAGLGSTLALCVYFDNDSGENTKIKHAKAVQNNNDAKQKMSEAREEKERALALHERVTHLLKEIDQVEIDFSDFFRVFN